MWESSLPGRLFGVRLASTSAGLGELWFLGMTHFYEPFAVPFWSSGTGGTGLIGAGLYVLATGWVGWSVRESLMVFGFFPVAILGPFFELLPLATLCVGAEHGRRGMRGPAPRVRRWSMGRLAAVVAPRMPGCLHILDIQDSGCQLCRGKTLIEQDISSVGRAPSEAQEN